MTDVISYVTCGHSETAEQNSETDILVPITIDFPVIFGKGCSSIT